MQDGAIRSGSHPASLRRKPGEANERRKDIQALRAFAVLCVMLFHINGWLPNGFVGVDIFFVISGYVISMVYLDRLRREPTMAVAYAFLRRRALRLMPALLCSMAVTFVLTLLLFPPNENKFIALASGLSSLCYASNLFFIFHGTSYWLATLALNPFLHTWSLGVEWQLYMVFPLVFIVSVAVCSFLNPLWREKLLISVLVVGFAGSIMLFLVPAQYEKWMFYSPVTRGWQFLIGVAVLVLARVRPAASALAIGPFVRAASLLAVAAAVFAPRELLSERAASLVSSLAAAILLMAPPSSSSALGRFVGLSSVQALGTASYSIYLVHWPIAVFGRLLVGDTLPAGLLMLGASLACGFALSKSVEFSLLGTSRPNLVFMRLACVMLAAGVAAAARNSLTALPHYSNSIAVPSVDGFHNYWWTALPSLQAFYRHNATFDAAESSRRLDRALHLYETRMGSPSPESLIVGIGNSYIQSSGAILHSYARGRGAELRVFNIMDCVTQNEVICSNAFKYATDFLERRKDNIDLIYVAFRGLTEVEIVTKNVQTMLRRLEGADVRIVVQGPSPVLDGYDPISCIAFSRPCTNFVAWKESDIHFRNREQSLTRLFDAHKRLSIWSPYRAFCDAEGCAARADDVSYFVDSDHFSVAGQRFLVPFFLAHIELERKD